MPKRIQLPSADDLFAEPSQTGLQRGGAAVRGESAPAPRGPRATTSTAPPPLVADAPNPAVVQDVPAPDLVHAAPQPPRPAVAPPRTHATAKPAPRRRATSAPASRRTRASSKPAARPASRPRTAVRIQRLEARLGALPIDALLELRDELEDLLAAPELHVAEVDRLLSTAGV